MKNHKVSCSFGLIFHQSWIESSCGGWNDRDSRWGSLSELRAALLQFQPGFLQNAPRSTRIRAAIVDAADY